MANGSKYEIVDAFELRMTQDVMYYLAVPAETTGTG
jgi:hypothetical protein